MEVEELKKSVSFLLHAVIAARMFAYLVFLTFLTLFKLYLEEETVRTFQLIILPIHNILFFGSSNVSECEH